MGRLIGYMANRTDRMADALTEEKVAVGPASGIEADAWGIGFYQGGEVLHKKRPRSALERESLAWKDVAGNVRSDCAVVHFRTATVGDFRSENTHPFRMRQWLFAHNGTISGFDAVRDALLESMPDFLRRNIRGTTDSEHVFHSLLAFLHDRSQLDNPDIESKVVLGAMRSTIALIDRLVSEIGAPEATLSFVLTNGREMYAARRGDPMHWTERELTTDARGASSAFRYVMVASNGPEAPPDWRPMKNGQALVIGRDLEAALVDL
ncbi:MAG: class II glutamine amidotransferase [Myxococcota bacterium]|nr:class II glutamine amidotransferase [Myxococcota bacterium]